jgi:serine/threonine protein kinase
MKLPLVSSDDLKNVIPALTTIDAPTAGGQKLVFRCTMGEMCFALKVMLAGDAVVGGETEEDGEDILDEVTARAKREVAIISACETPHVVKAGPIPLTAAEINGQKTIYFSEEWIEGRDLSRILQDGSLSIADVVELGRAMTLAIQALWEVKKIHRDIKPGNIMRRDGAGHFVLLDMGIAFDPLDVSLTAAGVVIGTMIYVSPEQVEYAKKRQMDFRSDCFSLGMVMYEAVTGRHPFWVPGMLSQQAVGNILMSNPERPRTYRPEMPAELERIILRLLGKQPHLRYRTCEDLLAALGEVPLT